MTDEPTSTRQAVALATEGDWSVWDPCAGCGADAGQPCRSLSIVRPGETRPTKRRPCAGRDWRRAE